ncbi:vesicle-associated membrane protein 5-like [Lytechinus variegatus]|uniref:vesicle-associated membrane protein 5-like n=1 Tax=Lytechinus variegatus TaxID=7654 RepID=UPI001BB219D3|nr:vesicle-associated membrane protein 5-like [Lytechinus variegatus]XP_041472276.1 vesicle-associated membrane protein 5-like [Lytechinus variegatus]
MSAELKKDKKDNDNRKKNKKKKGKKRNDGNIDDLQQDVDQVAEIMVTNIDKLLERGDKLEDLMENAEDLEAQAKGFQVVTKKVKENEKWKYRKTKICLALIIFFILIAVVAIILLIVKPW